MGFRVYFFKFPEAFNRDLRRNIDNKSSMDLRIDFLLFPQAFDKYQRRNINNKSSIYREIDPEIHRGLMVYIPS